LPENLILNEIYSQITQALNNANDELVSDRIGKSLKLIKSLISQARLNSHFSAAHQTSISKLKKPSTTKIGNNNSNSPCDDSYVSNDDDDDTEIRSTNKYPAMSSNFLLQKRFSLLNSSYIPQSTAATSKQQRSVSLKNQVYTKINDFCHQQQSPDEEASNIHSLRSSTDLDDFVESSSSQIKMISALSLIKYDDDFEENIAASSLNSNISNPSKTSDYDSGESPNSSDYNSDTDKLQLKEQYINNVEGVKKMERIKEDLLNGHGKVKNKSLPVVWHPDDIRSIHFLEHIHAWNFPIFQLYEKSDNNILSHVS